MFEDIQRFEASGFVAGFFPIWEKEHQCSKSPGQEDPALRHKQHQGLGFQKHPVLPLSTSNISNKTRFTRDTGFPLLCRAAPWFHQAREQQTPNLNGQLHHWLQWVLSFNGISNSKCFKHWTTQLVPGLQSTEPPLPLEAVPCALPD